MKRAFLLTLLLTGCYAEWDVPKTPRRDPCTGEVTTSYVYVMPACHRPSTQVQR